MYPVRLGYSVAVRRMKSMAKNGHHAEALVSVAFTAEKTLRRTLRQLVVSAGFPSRLADKIVGGLRGLESIKQAWEFYDPGHRALLSIIGNADWAILKKVAQMRNDLVHGVKAYSLSLCATETTNGLKALDNIKTKLDAEYGYSGWQTAKARRTSTLHTDPKVKWTR